MWGLVVSALTIGASYLGKPNIESTSRPSESTQLLATGGDRTFLSGVGTCTDVGVPFADSSHVRFYSHISPRLHSFLNLSFGNGFISGIRCLDAGISTP
jgi:hypothetical protein